MQKERNAHLNLTFVEKRSIHIRNKVPLPTFHQSTFSQALDHKNSETFKHLV